MRRIVGVIIAVLGVLAIVAGIVLHGGRAVIGSGAFALLVGAIVFGLSFIKGPEVGPDAPPPLSPAERILGVFYEPGRVFQNLRYHPRWLAAFLVIVLCSVIYQVAFTQRMTPEKIATVTADKVIEGGWIPPERQDQFRQQSIDDAKSPVGRVAASLNAVGGIFIFMIIMAGLFFLLVMVFGGRLGFMQALAVATYSALPPLVITNLLGLVLLYIKSPDDIDPIKGQRGLVRADLGILFSPAAHPILYTLAGSIGIISIYGLWLMATGLNNTGEKVSRSTAWTVALLLWGLGVLLSVGAALLFPSFVS
ncbi:MAG: YIP1 family protein [Acidobacteria bacterium]|nr:YIP1 family protein [Acidobacteriota bacterium]